MLNAEIYKYITGFIDFIINDNSKFTWVKLDFALNILLSTIDNNIRNIDKRKIFLFKVFVCYFLKI